MSLLLLLFIVVPLAEALLLAKIGALVGWTATIGIVIGTGVLGAWLFRLEGSRAWRKWQEAVAAGRMPEEGVVGGLLLLLGGAFLVTPGVITDVLGLLLLLPPTRKALAAYLGPRLRDRFFGGSLDGRAGPLGGGPFGAGGPFPPGGRGPRVQVIHFGHIGPVHADPAPDSGAERAQERDAEGVIEAEVIGRRVPVASRLRRAPRVIDADFEVVDSGD